MAKTPRIAQKIGLLSKCNKSIWNNNKKYNIKKFILNCKIKQHPSIGKNLLRTGLKPIIYTCKNESFFGIGFDNKGKNMLGKILMDIRQELYRKYNQFL